MNVCNIKSYSGEKRSIAFCLVVLVAVFVVSSRSCQADQPSLNAILSDPLKQIGWVQGPEKVTLGDFADFDVPSGYRLTDAHGARVILQSYNTPTTDGVIGLLASTSGKWWAVIEYTPEGYIRDAGAQQIDAAAVLKAAQTEIQKRDSAQGAPVVTSLSWKSMPVYDANMHSLAWSLQIQTLSMKTVNDAVVLLGRRGILEITAVPTSGMDDSSALKQLIGDITFKDGERYTDYQAGDKIADIGLAQLISGEDHAAAAGGGFAALWIYWVYSGIGACIIVGIVGLLLMKKRSRPARVAAPVAATHAHAAQPAMAASTVAASPAVASATVASSATPAVAAASNGHQNGVATAKAPAGQAKNPKQFHRNRKKKVFNYPKFYTNVMRELSLHSYGPGAPFNGKSNGHSNGHHHNGNSNGHTNGHSNGNTNGHSNGNGANGTNGTSPVNDAIKTEIAELIASQKNLIEEQKCLLEQQTKLIAEKRWLIEEQSAFLKGQIDNR